MAPEFVFGLAKSVVQSTLTMARSVMEEEKVQKSVQRDLVIISDEFEMMHAFLSTTKERVTDEMTRTLVRQVRNTALDMEESFDTVVNLDNSSRWCRLLLACVPMSVPARSLDAVLANLELLKARIVEAMGQRNTCYGRDAVAPEVRRRCNNDCAGHPSEARHPLNKRRCPKDLSELICSGDCLQLRVVSVWGGTHGDLDITSMVRTPAGTLHVGHGPG
jgi:hypothetical protein